MLLLIFSIHHFIKSSSLMQNSVCISTAIREKETLSLFYLSDFAFTLAAFSSLRTGISFVRFERKPYQKSLTTKGQKRISNKWDMRPVELCFYIFNRFLYCFQSHFGLLEFSHPVKYKLWMLKIILSTCSLS